ncbi:MAG: hypothetical protein LAO21_01075 [Acidobacteriia bacterium]|nr:hypothetical protein [Terriglobia bacterium]
MSAAPGWSVVLDLMGKVGLGCRTHAFFACMRLHGSREHQDDPARQSGGVGFADMRTAAVTYLRHPDGLWSWTSWERLAWGAARMRSLHACACMAHGSARMIWRGNPAGWGSQTCKKRISAAPGWSVVLGLMGKIGLGCRTHAFFACMRLHGSWERQDDLVRQSGGVGFADMQKAHVCGTRRSLLACACMAHGIARLQVPTIGQNTFPNWKNHFR